MGMDTKTFQVTEQHVEICVHCDIKEFLSCIFVCLFCKILLNYVGAMS